MAPEIAEESQNSKVGHPERGKVPRDGGSFQGERVLVVYASKK